MSSSCLLLSLLLLLDELHHVLLDLLNLLLEEEEGLLGGRGVGLLLELLVLELELVELLLELHELLLHKRRHYRLLGGRCRSRNSSARKRVRLGWKCGRGGKIGRGGRALLFEGGEFRFDLLVLVV